MWTVFSVLFLIAGIALLGWHHARHARRGARRRCRPAIRWRSIRVTPSMQATAKYFWLVIALFLAQILLGAITAHYQVEGQDSVRLHALRRPALLAHAHLAHAARGAVDRDRVARHGPVHRARDLGPRAEVPALRRQLPVRVPAHHRGRRVRRPVAGRDAEARPRPATSGSATRAGSTSTSAASGRCFLFVGLRLWLTLVGRALWPAIRKGGESKSIIVLLFLSTVVHRPVLRRRAHVGRAHAPLDGRVLALVGGAPVGGRLLRSLRHRGDRVPLHAARPAAREHGDRRGAVRDDRVPVRRRARHAAPPVLHRHADAR